MWEVWLVMDRTVTPNSLTVRKMHIAKYSLLLTVLKGRSFKSIFANHELI